MSGSTEFLRAGLGDVRRLGRLVAAGRREEPVVRARYGDGPPAAVAMLSWSLVAVLRGILSRSVLTDADRTTVLVLRRGGHREPVRLVVGWLLVGAAVVIAAERIPVAAAIVAGLCGLLAIADVLRRPRKALTARRQWAQQRGRRWAVPGRFWTVVALAADETADAPSEAVAPPPAAERAAEAPSEAVAPPPAAEGTAEAPSEPAAPPPAAEAAARASAADETAEARNEAAARRAAEAPSEAAAPPPAAEGRAGGEERAARLLRAAARTAAAVRRRQALAIVAEAQEGSLLAGMSSAAGFEAMEGKGAAIQPFEVRSTLMRWAPRPARAAEGADRDDVKPRRRPWTGRATPERAGRGFARAWIPAPAGAPADAPDRMRLVGTWDRAGRADPPAAPSAGQAAGADGENSDPDRARKARKEWSQRRRRDPGERRIMGAADLLGIGQVALLAWQLHLWALLTILPLALLALGWSRLEARRVPVQVTAWQWGTEGEGATEALLAPLEELGCVILHDRTAPESGALIDHFVVAPSGVWVIETKSFLEAVELRGANLLAGVWSLHDDLVAARDRGVEVRRVLEAPASDWVRPTMAVHGRTKRLGRTGREVSGAHVIAAHFLPELIATEPERLPAELIEPTARVLDDEFPVANERRKRAS